MGGFQPKLGSRPLTRQPDRWARFYHPCPSRLGGLGSSFGAASARVSQSGASLLGWSEPPDWSLSPRNHSRSAAARLSSSRDANATTSVARPVIAKTSLAAPCTTLAAPKLIQP